MGKEKTLEVGLAEPAIVEAVSMSWLIDSYYKWLEQRQDSGTKAA